MSAPRVCLARKLGKYQYSRYLGEFQLIDGQQRVRSRYGRRAGRLHAATRRRLSAGLPDDGRDDFILQERLSGRSARSIGKQLRLTVGEVDASLDRTLPTIDNDARRRYVALDLNRLDGLLGRFELIGEEVPRSLGDSNSFDGAE